MQARYYGPLEVDDGSCDSFKAQTPLVIGVAGGTASGKTSVCNQIIKKLQQDPVRLPCDLDRLRNATLDVAFFSSWVLTPDVTPAGPSVLLHVLEVAFPHSTEAQPIRF